MAKNSNFKCVWVVARLHDYLVFWNFSLIRRFPSGTLHSKKKFFYVDFSLWGKQYIFPKLHFFSNFSPLRQARSTQLLTTACKILYSTYVGTYILLFEEGHTVRILSSFEFMAVCKNSAVHTHARLLKWWTYPHTVSLLGVFEFWNVQTLRKINRSLCMIFTILLTLWNYEQKKLAINKTFFFFFRFWWNCSTHG